MYTDETQREYRKNSEILSKKNLGKIPLMEENKKIGKC